MLRKICIRLNRFDIFDIGGSNTWRDIIFFIKIILNVSTTMSFPQRFGHGFSKHIRIENHFTIWITRSTSNNLYQGRSTTKKSLFVSIKYSNQRNLRQINPLSQQINSNQNIDLTRSEFFDNLSTFHGRDFRVQIVSLIPTCHKKIRNLLAGLFCQSQKQYFSSFRNMSIYLFEEMVNKWHISRTIRVEIVVEIRIECIHGHEYRYMILIFKR